ncbi:PcfB family protein [Ruminococcaceae bacterium OttesenSCG-928-A11]|nr:PcfB family protein [Ruminococcaceae bacterium OttesenSCG-928-A11]
MSQGSDVADQVVQEGIQVTESAVKLAGLGVKNLAILLLQLLQDNKKLSGKTGLNSLLQTNKPLVTFSMDRDALPVFKQMAADYGILFSSVHQRGNSGQCDIMVKADDASLMRRIFEVMKQPGEQTRQSSEGRGIQNWLQKAVERLTEPAKRLEGKTGPLEGLGAETLAALVYQLAAENRQHLEASPLSHIFEEGKGLQIVEVPGHCKRDIAEQAEVLGVPVHFQPSETAGKVTMMAKGEDAPIINRLFENMGMNAPMQDKVAGGLEKTMTEAIESKTMPDKNIAEKTGERISVVAAFSEAKGDAAAKVGAAAPTKSTPAIAAAR